MSRQDVIGHGEQNRVWYHNGLLDATYSIFALRIEQQIARFYLFLYKHELLNSLFWRSKDKKDIQFLSFAIILNAIYEQTLVYHQMFVEPKPIFCLNAS